MKALFIRILLVLAFLSGFHLPLGDKFNIVYISPLPGSHLLPAGTTITIRLAYPISESDIAQLRFETTGSMSGSHSGELILAKDRRTVIFAPTEIFQAGESVQIRIVTQRPIYGTTVIKEFQFEISPELFSDQQRMDILASVDDLRNPGQSATPAWVPLQQISSFKTVTDDIPSITVTTSADQTADGYLFLSDFHSPTGDSRAYNLIVDNFGEIVYYQKLLAAYDFKVLPNGTLSYFDRTINNFVILDNSYQVIDMIKPGNGYPTADAHDLQMTPEGNYLYLIYDPQVVDMSAYGGNPQANVIGLVIQELDPNKNVVFQWRSWDHYQFTDTYVDLTAASVDYVHGNAVEVDNSGNLMVSQRHMAEITKINRETGDIIWRLGGKNNEFTFLNDTRGFYFQHDIRQLANGDITLFDNHNDGVPSYSRSVQYELDENAKTVTQVSEFRKAPDTYSRAMGNSQRLPNGNTLIGWGLNTNQVLTEFKPDGSLAFEMVLEPGYISYRSYRLTWHGYPTWLPALVVQAQGNDVVLSTSWNGATEIASYRVYAGKTLLPATFLSEQIKTGFETTITLAGLGNTYCYFRVIPIDKLGRTTQYSDTTFNPACAEKQYFMPMISSISPN